MLGSCSSSYRLIVVVVVAVVVDSLLLFIQVSVMSTLDLSFNRLTTVQKYGLSNVGRLDVSYNTVEKVADDALAGLHRSLAELDLGYNRLTHVADAVLRNARALLVLDLRHNYLGPKFGAYSFPASSVGRDDLASFAAHSTGNLFQVNTILRKPRRDMRNKKSYNSCARLTRVTARAHNVFLGHEI